jgi:hypothetical protein
MHNKSPTKLLRNCICELRGSNPWHDADYTNVFRGFPQSLRANAWTVPQTGHSRSFYVTSNSFFTVILSSRIIYTPSAVKETNKGKQRRQTLCGVASWQCEVDFPCVTGSGNSTQLTLLGLGNNRAYNTGERGPSVTGNRRSPKRCWSVGVGGGVSGGLCCSN